MTICEKCGAEREYIDAGCPVCQFRPTTMRELATASLLTTQFEAGSESFGMPPQALDAIRNGIRAGKPPTLDENELLRHERTVEAFLQVKPIHVYGALFRFFLPAILLIGALWGLVLLLRLIGH